MSSFVASFLPFWFAPRRFLCQKLPACDGQVAKVHCVKEARLAHGRIRNKAELTVRHELSSARQIQMFLCRWTLGGEKVLCE